MKPRIIRKKRKKVRKKNSIKKAKILEECEISIISNQEEVILENKDQGEDITYVSSGDKYNENEDELLEHDNTLDPASYNHYNWTIYFI